MYLQIPDADAAIEIGQISTTHVQHGEKKVWDSC